MLIDKQTVLLRLDLILHALLVDLGVHEVFIIVYRINARTFFGVHLD